MKKYFKIMLVVLFVFQVNILVNENLSIISDVSAANYTSNQVVELAKKQIGKPYKTGKSGPDSFDCVGLVKYVYGKCGITLPMGTSNYSGTKYKKYGTYIKIANLQAGDIVFYGSSQNNLSHAGIYIGNGLMVNALKHQTGVIYNYINKAAYNKASNKKYGYCTSTLQFGLRVSGRVSLGSVTNFGQSFSAYIQNKYSGKYLTNEKDNLVLKSYGNYTASKQKFIFTRNSDGSYYIKSTVNSKMIDVASGKDANKTNIRLYKANNTASQKWFIHKNYDGTYTFRPAISKTRVLDVSDGKYTEGKNIWLWQNNNGNAQKFVINMKDEITFNYDANGGTGSVSSQRLMYGQQLTVSNGSNVKKTGYTFVGWNAYRVSDKKYFCTNGAKWQTESAIKKYKYTKAVYKPGNKYTINGSWTSTKNGHQKFTLVAIWKKNPAPASTLGIKNNYYPTGKYAVGSPFTISGEVTSNYPLKSVKVEVKAKAGGKTQFSAQQTFSNQAKYYSLYNLDSKMLFSKLKTGTYVYTITATDTKTTKTLTSSQFSVVSSNIYGRNLNYPTTYTKGNYFTIKGTVGASNGLKNVTAIVHKTNGTQMFCSSANTTAKSYDVYKLDKKMSFSKLGKGDYIYRVSVVDSNNVERFVVSKKFTVK